MNTNHNTKLQDLSTLELAQTNGGVTGQQLVDAVKQVGENCCMIAQAFVNFIS